MDGGLILGYARSEFFVNFKTLLTSFCVVTYMIIFYKIGLLLTKKNIHDNFYSAGGDILLLQESYIHIDSILVHLSNWIFWSEILRRLVSVIVQCHIYSAACDHCGAF